MKHVIHVFKNGFTLLTFFTMKTIDFMTQQMDVFRASVAVLSLTHLYFQSIKIKSDDVFNRLSNENILVSSI